MKNYIPLILLIFLIDGLNAQITLTHNTDNIITGVNSVACPGGDNSQARLFNLASFGITDDFEISSGEVGVQECNVATTVTVNVWDVSSIVFPGGFPGTSVLLASQTVNIPVVTSGNGIVVPYNFPAPFVVPAAATDILVEVLQPLDGVNFFLGGTAEELDDSWIASENCGVTIHTDTDAIGFPDAHFYITVTGDNLLSADEFVQENFKVHPNPASDFLNIYDFDATRVKHIEIFNSLGQLVLRSATTSRIDIRGFGSGVYLISFSTEAGTETRRFVKK